MRAYVHVSGSTVTIDGSGPTISFWLDTDAPPDLDATFALWAMLPLAMRAGEPLHIEGAIDVSALENANKLSRIWAMWAPEQFSVIDVTAAETLPAQPTSQNGSLYLYSGGVDSTHAMLTADQPPKYALTVHGLDYAADKSDGFAALKAKTDPFLDRLGCERITLRTDIYKHWRKRTDVGHAFCLAACAFVFQHRFQEAVIAADYTWAQDMVVFPWGSNHVTNPLFASGSFRLRTACADKNRTEKLALLADDLDACRALSFCKDKTSRPHNCGVCIKCLRTKAMFVAVTGTFPPIFNDERLDARFIASLDVEKEYAFVADIYIAARDNGNLGKLPGLEDLMERHIRTKRDPGVIRRLERKARQWYTAAVTRLL